MNGRGQVDRACGIDPANHLDLLPGPNAPTMALRVKTLHAYLTRQVIASLLMTVAVFTFVLLLASVVKEILPLLVSGQVRFGVVAEAIGLLIPFVWVFALPMGVLTATLLIFGRLSADQELTAVRASGISLLSVISPVLLLSLLLCTLSAIVNMEIGPRCRVAYKSMFLRVQAEFTSAQLPEKRYIKEFRNHIIYVGKNRRGILEDIMVYRFEKGTNQMTQFRAPRGSMEVDTTNKCIILHVYGGKGIIMPEGKYLLGDFDYTVYTDSSRKGDRGKSLSDMTFTELRDELHDLERRMEMPLPVQNAATNGTSNTRQELKNRRKDLTSPVRVQMHRQVAFSFACFGFTLVGIPLGMRVHRRETNIGIAMALVLVAVYYSFVLLAQALDSHPEWAPHLIVWLPNFIFQVVGAVLLFRANRGIA